MKLFTAKGVTLVCSAYCAWVLQELHNSGETSFWHKN